MTGPERRSFIALDNDQGGHAWGLREKGVSTAWPNKL